MANSFNSVQVRKPNSNTFDLSHDHKYSMDMGKLVPVLVQEVVPGDVFNIRTETLIRFSPLISPVMHNIRVFTHYFFVPNRIVWPNWEDFISPDLSKETPPAWPYLAFPANDLRVRKGTLWDYLGLPVGKAEYTGNFPNVSALPFAAYQKIYNEYYRDQNLVAEEDITLNNGSIIVGAKRSALTALRTRAWQHDYFTAALPFAQKGPSVSLPLGEDAPVYRNAAGTGAEFVWTGSGDTAYLKNILTDSPEVGAEEIYADLSGATASTINDLRVAMRLQEWFEKAARGGSRYVEQLLVHFGVRSSDKRLNRPEFLGGTRNPVIISEVLQTSETSETPQANMSGHGISASTGRNIRYFAEEHGYIIGIQSIMPSTAYMQGIPKHFSRQSWEDYLWPTFAHLGEQPILNKELYVDPSDGKDDDTFGYIPRYSEYRYTPSRVSGDFRDTLAHWHMARKFSSRPNLNKQFIEAETTPNGGVRNDIFAVTSADLQKLWCHSYHKIYVRRKLPKYGTPTL